MDAKTIDELDALWQRCVDVEKSRDYVETKAQMENATRQLDSARMEFLSKLRKSWPAISRTLRQQAWIPVSKRLPETEDQGSGFWEESDWVLIYTPGLGISTAYYFKVAGNHGDSETGWKYGDTEERAKPTHWMPLPTAPHKEKDSDE